MPTHPTVWLRVPVPAGEAARLRAAHPGVCFVQGDAPDAEALAAVTVLLTAEAPTDETIARMPALAWVHTTHGGAGAVLTGPVRARGAAVSTSRGTHSPSFVEFTLAALFAFARDIPGAVRAKDARAWQEAWAVREVAGSTVGIVGLGAVGSAIAAALAPLGVRAVGTRAHPERALPEGVAEAHGPDWLPHLLAQADAVVLAAPATEATRHLLDAQAFAALRPGALVINLTTRGGVDEDALAEALVTGRVGGAALNVFSSPNLAPNSPLWAAPNVLIAPRLGSTDPGKWPRQCALFEENLRRHLAGEPLLNAVSPDAAY
ncbi:MAG: D-2-hydroxyacid dehydrogenase [Chloroflexota bacterium]